MHQLQKMNVNKGKGTSGLKAFKHGTPDRTGVDRVDIWFVVIPLSSETPYLFQPVHTPNHSLLHQPLENHKPYKGLDNSDVIYPSP